MSALEEDKITCLGTKTTEGKYKQGKIRKKRDNIINKKNKKKYKKKKRKRKIG